MSADRGIDELVARHASAARPVEVAHRELWDSGDDRRQLRALLVERPTTGTIDLELVAATLVETDDGWQIDRWSPELRWRGARRVRRPLDADALVLCSGTISPTVRFVEKAAAAASAGFDGISIYLREIDAAIAAGWSAALLCAYLDLLGLTVAETDGMFAWLDGATVIGDALDTQLRSAQSVGARSVTLLLPPGPALAPEAVSALAGRLAIVADRAAELGLLVHLEPFAWSGLRSIAAAAELCRRADRPNAGLMLDTWHLAAGPDRGRLPDELTGTSVFGIQLCECADPDPPDLARAGMHERLPPGDGPAATAAIVRELRARGCRAPAGVEIYSDVVHALPAVDAATGAMSSLRQVLTPEAADDPPQH